MMPSRRLVTVMDSNDPSTGPTSARANPPKRLVLGCGALAHELVAALAQHPETKAHTKLHCLPAKLHNTPQFIASAVDDYLTEHGAQYDDILVAYGDCGTAGALDEVLNTHQATRLPGAHCYEFYAGTDLFERLQDQELGSFYLTDFLVRHFERLVIEGLGLDRNPEMRAVYFRHYRKLVYLAQTEDAQLQAEASAIAQRFGWDYDYQPVGLAGLAPIVGRSVSIPVQLA